MNGIKVLHRDNDGEYDYLSQSIFIMLTKQNFETIKEAPFLYDFIKHYRVMCHEATHYYDNIATLYGQKLLIGAIESLNSIKSTDELDKYKIIDFNNNLKKVFHDDYYKIIYKDIKDNEISNWDFMSSFGYRYNHKGRIDENKPIVFTRFSNKNECVARIPIALESIWECNAIASELITFVVELKKKYDTQIEIDIEISNLEKELKDYIYNSSNLVYSNITHFISKYVTGSGDLLNAYYVTRTISGICSNLPYFYYNRLKVPKIVSKNINGKLISRFKQNHDVGFLFLCLVFNFYEKYDPNKITPLITLSNDFGEILLSESNLPNKEILEKEIKIEMEKNIKEYDRSIDILEIYLKGMLTKGLEIFSNMGLFNSDAEYFLKMEQLKELPFVFLDDESSLQFKRSDNINKLCKNISEFIRACNY